MSGLATLRDEVLPFTLRNLVAEGLANHNDGLLGSLNEYDHLSPRDFFTLEAGSLFEDLPADVLGEHFSFLCTPPLTPSVPIPQAKPPVVTRQLREYCCKLLLVLKERKFSEVQRDLEEDMRDQDMSHKAVFTRNDLQSSFIEARAQLSSKNADFSHLSSLLISLTNSSLRDPLGVWKRVRNRDGGSLSPTLRRLVSSSHCWHVSTFRFSTKESSTIEINQTQPQFSCRHSPCAHSRRIPMGQLNENSKKLKSIVQQEKKTHK